MCHMSFDNSSSSMIHTFLPCNSATFPTWDNVFRCCPKWNKTMSIFRMLSNIYDGAFSRRRRLLESSIINVWHGPEAVVQRCSVEKVFLEIWQNLPVSESLFLQLYKKETRAQVFSHEFWEVSKKTFSYRTPSVAASHGLLMYFWKFDINTLNLCFWTLRRSQEPRRDLRWR